jgi:hypothetical protein
MSEALIAELRKQLKGRDDQLLATAKDLKKLRTIEAALLAVVPELGILMAGAEDSAVIALIEFARKKALRVRELEGELRKVKANA